MAFTSYADVLTPAFCAACAGGAAALADASGGLTVAVATLAAAAGAMLRMRDENVGLPVRDTPAPTPPMPRPVDTAVHAAFQAMPVGVLIVAPDRMIRTANAEVAGMFGMREVAGQPVSTLRARRLLDRIDYALEHRTSSVLDFNLSRAADMFLKAHVVALGTGDVLVALQDETQARRAGELHRDFVANASHELKTPLAAVTGIIETLLGHARDDPEATERFLGLLASQTDRMARLVSDLLSLNRIELNERVLPDRPENVIQIVLETVDALTPIAEASNVCVAVDLPSTPWIMLADRDELSQLFRNLIDNAIKYGGENSKVDIRISSVPPDRSGMIGIEIIDQGPGIAREHLPRLTERFYRVNARHSREKGGTGLGLAIVKHILNRHRGHLQVESKLDEGSCFCVWLPVLDAADSVADKIRPESVLERH